MLERLPVRVTPVVGILDRGPRVLLDPAPRAGVAPVRAPGGSRSSRSAGGCRRAGTADSRGRPSGRAANGRWAATRTGRRPSAGPLWPNAGGSLRIGARSESVASESIVRLATTDPTRYELAASAFLRAR